MSMGKRKCKQQPVMWITTTDLPTAASHPFYRRLNQLLREHRFDDFAEAPCAVFYAKMMGRTRLPPGVSFRLLLIVLVPDLPLRQFERDVVAPCLACQFGLLRRPDPRVDAIGCEDLREEFRPVDFERARRRAVLGSRVPTEQEFHHGLAVKLRLETDQQNPRVGGRRIFTRRPLRGRAKTDSKAENLLHSLRQRL
jgi:hypothetical protein